MRFLPALASAALALLVFAISVGGTYIYDDITIIQTDERLVDPSLWWRYWAESYNQGVDNLYRPLVSMTYAIEWWLHGDRPWIFHLINVLLHAGVSACLAEFVRRMAGARAALVAGLLFAVHPIHVEAVANIVGRAELLCALGSFGALVLFLRPMSGARAVAITGCFVLALLSKEQGMFVPLMLLILAMARRFFAAGSDPPADPSAPPVPAKDPQARQGMLLLVLLLCWGLAGYIVWRESILKFWWDRNFLDWSINPMAPTDSHPFGGSVGRDRWLMPLALLGRYTALLVAPIKLSPDYGSRVIGWTVQMNDPYLFVGIGAVVGWMIVLTVCLLKRSALGVFAALSLAITYGMVGNVVALIGTNFAERLMYLPSAFFLILIAMALSQLNRKVLIAAMSVLIVLGSLRSYTYARRWNDKLEFYKTCLEEQPKSIRLHMLLASEYQARGQLAEAERVVRAGTEVLPEYWEIWVHYALVMMQQERFDEAQKYLDHAMNIRPSMRIQAWMESLDRRRKAAATRAATAPATQAIQP